MTTILRFFVPEYETTIAELDITNCMGLIPQKNSEVILDDILNETVPDDFDYEYFTVRKISYSYSDNLTLVDVFVRGWYWENEE